MANDIEFKIVATDNGTFKIVTVAAKGLNSELDKTAKAQARAAKESDTHTNTLAKGAMGAGSAGRDFGKLAQSINGGSGSLVGAYATLAANIFAVGAAFTALKNAAQVQQLEEGIARMGNRLGITLSQTAYSVRDLSGGMLSLEQSFRSTAQAAAGGIKSADIEKLAKLAKDASYALGRDMTDSMDRLTKGVLKLEPELLDELGIMTRLDQSNRIYAASLGKTAGSLTAVEKQTGFMNAVLAEGEAKLGDLSKNASGTGLAKLAASFADLTTNVMQFLNMAAEPLAAIMSASPGSMVGGALLFASTISKQLVPGLKTMTVETLAASKAAKDLAIAKLYEVNAGKSQGRILTNLTRDYDEGNASVNSFADGIKILGTQISQAEAKGDLGKVRDRTAEYDKVLVAAKAVAEAEKAHSLANLESALSNGNLIEMGKKLTNVYEVSTTALEVANTGATAGRRAMNGLAFGFNMVNISARAAGIAIMEALNIIGIIITVVSLAIDAFKFLYKVMQGEEVIKAQQNLSAVTAQLTDRVKEYYRIQESNAMAAAKEVSTAKLVTNTLMEQVAAVEALAAAKKAKREEDQTKTPIKPIYSDVLTTQGMKREVVNQDELDKVGKIDSETTFKTRKVLKDLSKSDIPEYNAAIVAAAGSQKNFNKILNEGSGEQLLALLNSLGTRIKNYSPVIDEFSGALTELSKSYSDLIKSFQPTTPYDNVVKSLERTRSALSNARNEMSNGIVTSEKLGKILSSIDINTVATMSFATPEQAQSINELVSKTDELTGLQNKLNDLEKLGIGHASEKRDITKQIVDLQSKLSPISNKALKVMQDLTDKELERFKIEQRSSAQSAADISLAQARLSVLNSYTALSGKDTELRINAENSIIQLQISQIKNKMVQEKQDIAAQKTALATTAIEVEKLLILNKQSLAKDGILQQDAKSLKAQKALLDAKLQGEEGKKMSDAQRADALAASKTLGSMIDTLDKIDDTNSALDAQGKQIRALSMQMTSASVKAAEMNATEKTGLSALATARETGSKQAQTLVDKNIEAQKILTGNVDDTSDAYKNLANAQKATYASRVAALRAVNELEVANLEVQKAKAATEITKQRYQSLIDARKEYLKISLEILGVEDQIALTTLLQIKNVEGLAKTRVDSLTAELDISTKLADSAKTILDNNLAIAKMKREVSGEPITAVQAAKEAKAVAQASYNSAVQVSEIKLALIDAEYALLEAQLRGAQAETASRTADIEERKSKLDPVKDASLIASYNANIDANNLSIASMKLIIGKLPSIQKASRDVIESGLELAREQTIRAGMVTSLSGDLISGAGPTTTMTADQVSKSNNSISLGSTSDNTGTVDLVNTLGDTTVTGGLSKTTKFLQDFRLAMLNGSQAAAPFTKMLQSLGPEGELISALNTGMFSAGDSMAKLAQNIPKITGSFEGLKTAFKDGGFTAMFKSDAFQDFAKGAQAALGAASSLLSTIGSIYNASSKQRIAGIDKEIAAEQKRDGKSAESIAKIKALESKKEAMAKKAFEVNKKIMMAQAVMATAAAVIGALGSVPFGPWNIAFAAIIAGMGAAQLALIAGTSYSGGGSSVTAPSAPTALSIGKRSDSVDLAKSNTSAGGESGFVSGSQGMGTSASNFTRAAYGTSNTGRAGFIVGEKGPELFTPSVPGSITPNDKMGQGQAINATINIQAIDSAGVEELLTNKRGHIIGMLREAANANGQKFLENVDTKKYSQGGRRL